MTLFCTRSPPFMSSDVIFLQAKWSKIKERVEGWKSGKTSRFKRITVWVPVYTLPFPAVLLDLWKNFQAENRLFQAHVGVG